MNTDEKTFDEIYLQYYNTIFKYCNYKLNNNYDADDITSEVFLLLYQKWNSFDSHPDSGILTWLYRSASFMIQRHFKKGKMRPLAFEDVSAKLFDDEPDGNLQDRKYNEYVENIKNKLSEKDRILFEYIVIKKYNYKTISDEMQISENAVKLRWYRLRTELKDYIILYSK